MAMKEISSMWKKGKEGNDDLIPLESVEASAGRASSRKKNPGAGAKESPAAARKKTPSATEKEKKRTGTKAEQESRAEEKKKRKAPEALVSVRQKLAKAEAAIENQQRMLAEIKREEQQALLAAGLTPEAGVQITPAFLENPFTVQRSKMTGRLYRSANPFVKVNELRSLDELSSGNRAADGKRMSRETLDKIMKIMVPPAVCTSSLFSGARTELGGRIIQVNLLQKLKHLTRPKTNPVLKGPETPEEMLAAYMEKKRKEQEEQERRAMERKEQEQAQQQARGEIEEEGDEDEDEDDVEDEDSGGEPVVQTGSNGGEHVPVAVARSSTSSVRVLPASRDGEELEDVKLKAGGLYTEKLQEVFSDDSVELRHEGNAPMDAAEMLQRRKFDLEGLVYDKRIEDFVTVIVVECGWTGLSVNKVYQAASYCMRKAVKNMRKGRYEPIEVQLWGKSKWFHATFHPKAIVRVQNGKVVAASNGYNVTVLDDLLQQKTIELQNEYACKAFPDGVYPKGWLEICTQELLFPEMGVTGILLVDEARLFFEVVLRTFIGDKVLTWTERDVDQAMAVRDKLMNRLVDRMFGIQ